MVDDFYLKQGSALEAESETRTSSWEEWLEGRVERVAAWQKGMTLRQKS